jgi:hypothetical protein
VQKIGELTTLSHALTDGRNAVKDSLAASAAAVAARGASAKIHDPAVKARMAAVTPDMTRRRSVFEERRRIQRAQLSLPAFPTTTIGSFPRALVSGGAGLTFYAFDLLWLDGKDLRSRPLLERKAALADLLRRPPDRMMYSEHLACGFREGGRARLRGNRI